MLPRTLGGAILGGSTGMNPFMKQETGPPLIIPEEGLKVSPGMWQAIIIAACPIIAVVSIAIPLIFAGAVFFTLLSWALNYFFPLKYKPELMHQETTSDQSTLQHFEK